jgi:nicotinamide-nucleotide amidase
MDESEISDVGLARLVHELAGRLMERDWKMATAESCTGGWIAKCCTDLAGSSDWFDRGFVTYSNAAKQEMLGVKASTLERDGAVSKSVAAEMVACAATRAGVEVAVAVTGIAGPSGGSAEKPVGTVWFAWSCGGQVDTALAIFTGDREAVRRQTVAHALQGLVDRL